MPEPAASVDPVEAGHIAAPPETDDPATASAAEHEVGRSAGPFVQYPSQTVGPFYGYALPFVGGAEIVPPTHPDAVRVHGRVLDGAGDGVPDAVLETWQADPRGRRVTTPGSFARDPHEFTGFGRIPTDADGHFSLTTLKPGATSPSNAPYLVLTLFARGLSHHLNTRIYFADEQAANDSDGLLARLDPADRSTLLATVDGPRSYRFDVRLQGERETVFLTYDGLDADTGSPSGGA